MSKSSIYENDWINLVFENRNKEYGAFQLRQEITKTSFQSLFIGVLLCTALISLPHLLLHPKEIKASTIPDLTETIIQVQDIYSPEKQTAAAPVLLEAKAQTPIEIIDQKQLINPTIVSATQAPDVDFTIEKVNTKDNTTDGLLIAGSGTGEGIINGIGTGTTTDGTGTGTDTGTHIAEMLDTKPQFPGGIDKFYRYIGNNFNSPALDENKNVRIFVSFVVEKDGSMSSIKVLNKPGSLLEKEAIRVLQSIKSKWSPGILNSKPVRTAYNLPIIVQVN